MKQYHQLLKSILESPPDRDALAVSNSEITTGLGRFPIVTTNPVPFLRIQSELLWFLRGDVSTLHMQVLPGRAVLLSLPGLLEEMLPASKDKRWELIKTARPRTVFQFKREGDVLNGHLTLSSLDALSLWPVVFSSYSLLTWMIAQVQHFQPGHFTLRVDDCYISIAQRALAERVLARRRLPRPTLALKPDTVLPRGWDGLRAIRWHHLAISEYKTHVPLPLFFLPSEPIRDRKAVA